VKRRLVLFDIDGTLLLDNGASRDAFAAALREVYSFVAPLTPYDFSGKTDPQITYMVMRDAGIPDDVIEQGLGSLWTTYVEELRARIGRDSVRTMPHIFELLDILAGDERVMLALLTGNIEPGARIKLSPWELNRFFPFGAFGSDHRDREMLPPFAIERASQIDGHRFEGEDVVIIGDSIYDVRCGVPHGATTIAVSTGRTSAERLRAENPTFFCETLRPTDELLRVIRGD
jgi:phosphoglycolate phosphatase